MNRLILFALVSFFISCSETKTEIKQAVTTSENTYTDTRLIFKKEMYGDDWPFSINEIEVYCASFNEVYCRYDGKVYPLNGKAKGASRNTTSVSKIEDIWLDNPNMPGVKIPLPSEFIAEGLKLCK